MKFLSLSFCVVLFTCSNGCEIVDNNCYCPCAPEKFAEVKQAWDSFMSSDQGQALFVFREKYYELSDNKENQLIDIQSIFSCIDQASRQVLSPYPEYDGDLNCLNEYTAKHRTLCAYYVQSIRNTLLRLIKESSFRNMIIQEYNTYIESEDHKDSSLKSFLGTQLVEILTSKEQ